MHVITSSCFIGAFCDLVWSDPEEVDSWAVSPRGAGWLFGQSVTNDFMHTNHLKLICRAHQLVHEGMFANNWLKGQGLNFSYFTGFKYMFDGQLVTVWSAPNYCYRCGNVASILEFTDVDNRTPKLFDAVPDNERVIPTKAATPYFLWREKATSRKEQ